MSGADHVTINVRERPSSTDLNNLQSMQARTLLDLLNYASIQQLLGVPGLAVTPRNCVLGGLTVTPSGTNIVIAAGALLQSSATLAPAPGALDSSYRIGVLRAPYTMTLATPGVDSIFLIEAQMVEVTTTTESRDVLNSLTGNFVPTALPKQVERQLVFQCVTTVTAHAPAPSGGNWVPICAIRRAAGGGALVATDIVDARPMQGPFDAPSTIAPKVNGGRLIVTAAAPTVVTLDADIDGMYGHRVIQTQVAIDPSNASYLSPTTAIAASTWYYLYLAPWAGSHTVRKMDTQIAVEGVLVLSSVTPSSNARRNGAAIQLPSPYGVTDAASDTAYFIGAIRRNAANTGWVPMQSADLRQFDYLGGTANAVQIASLAPPVLGANNLTPANLPANVARYRVNGYWVGAAAGFTPVSVAASPIGSLAIHEGYANVDDDVASPQFFDLDVSAKVNGSSSFTLGVDLNIPNAASTCTLKLSKFWY
jgi:hypothetical protein